MRIAITGAGGFVGRWLDRDLVAHDHDTIAPPKGFEIRDAAAVDAWLADVRPDAVAHLAAISFGPDARARPEEALAVNVGGTVNVLEAVRRLRPMPIVLVSGSSEVYGVPKAEDIPLRETARLAPVSPYALSKLGQESVALAYAQREGLRLVVTRSFNHIGPGQRDSFVVPALTQRLMSVRAGGTDRVAVGNLDVRRDLSDVRDVVAAYRVLVETLAAGGLVAGGHIFNVCSGTSVAIRDVLIRLSALLMVEPVIEVDPGLVRVGDAPDIRGDRSAIATAIGWEPAIPLERTLADIVATTLTGATTRA